MEITEVILRKNAKTRQKQEEEQQFVVSGQCVNCVHRNTGKDNWATCAAFPNEIPMHIFVGNVLHNVPIHGDHGIQFEAIKDASQ